MSTYETNVWIAIPLFGALMPLGGVNGNLHWLFTHQTAEETIFILVISLLLDKTIDGINSNVTLTHNSILENMSNWPTQHASLGWPMAKFKQIFLISWWQWNGSTNIPPFRHQMLSLIGLFHH